MHHVPGAGCGRGRLVESHAGPAAQCAYALQQRLRGVQNLLRPDTGPPHHTGGRSRSQAVDVWSQTGAVRFFAIWHMQHSRWLEMIQAGSDAGGACCSQVDGDREEMERLQRGHSAGSRMFERIQQTNPALYQQLCSIADTNRGGSAASGPRKQDLGPRRGAPEPQLGPAPGCEEAPPEQTPEQN